MAVNSFESFEERALPIISNKFLTNDDILSIMGSMIVEIPLSIHETEWAYVLRCSPLDNDETCKNISRCRYPPESKAKLQRCNWIGQPVFYASVPCDTTNFKYDAVLPSLMETCMQKIEDEPDFNSQLIVASYWHPIRPLYVWSLPFHAHSVEHNKIFNQLHGEFTESMHNFFPDEYDFNETMKKCEFLSGLYCEKNAKEDVYRFTSTYYNLARQYTFDMTQQVILDGLIYPAAFSKGESMSVVLSKETIDQPALECSYTRLYHLLRNPTEANKIEFNLLAEATPDENGNLDFEAIIY